MLERGNASSEHGASITFSHAGNGRPPLFFIHGACGHRHHWEYQTGPLSDRYTVVALDLAGHGESTTGSRHAFTMQSFAHDIKAVMDHLKLSGVILVGHSMGAAVAVETGLLMPERIAGIVNVDGLLYPPYQAQTEDRVASAMQGMAADYAGAIGSMYRDNFGPGADRGMVERLATEACRVEARVGLSEIEALNRWDGDAAVAKLEPPLYSILQGAVDTLAEEHPLKERARKLDATFVDGAGHFIMLEAPEKFNVIMEQVIQTLQLP